MLTMGFFKWPIITLIGLLAVYEGTAATQVCRDPILADVRTRAVGAIDIDGFQEYESTDSSLTVKFAKTLEHLTSVKIKPPNGTQPQNKFRAEATYITDEGKEQTMRTGMTVSVPYKPLNLPFPSNSNIVGVQISVKVEVDGGLLPAPKTLTVAMKGCYVLPSTTKPVETTTPEEPKTTSQEPKFESQEPTATSQEPKAASEEPKAASQEPKAVSQEPKETSQEPKVESQEPKAVSQEPNAASQEPEATSQEPKVESQEPTAEAKEQKVDSNEQKEETMYENAAQAQAFQDASESMASTLSMRVSIFIISSLLVLQIIF